MKKEDEEDENLKKMGEVKTKSIDGRSRVHEKEKVGEERRWVRKGGG